MIDKFYPIIILTPIKELGLILKLHEHLKNARSGDRLSESKLANRLGTTRRSGNFRELDTDLQFVIKESVEFLRSTGRTIDLMNDDPRKWITQRDGKPRW
jgi:hypothetical protein